MVILTFSHMSQENDTAHKSTFAQALETFFPEFRRCNQDDLGNRRKVEAFATKALRQGLSVCIDRTNFDATYVEHHFLFTSNVNVVYPTANESIS